ncbi:MULTISPECIES: DUF3466 family protein [unclassified Alteromonas]|uniref:DUF3466 family protein n=1 Tax=unclassified Alteromonas TaxID=2614992 RepID=UPI0019244DFF|nr:MULTISPECIES: DUF3466 family protein [unclassified Alteromonas]WDT88022.1 DUF3466 family protein [Alteromonas sp. 009811495]BCO19136.1 hypothetical protein KUC3_19930 [Alteromonas sp. KC3]BCO23095.1 hypothetical protein KUC14_19640 [Alteromonas sp. KC14]
MKRTQLAAAVLLATGSVSAMAATYSVTPLPLQDTAVNNFARSIDNSGKMLTVVQREFNPPVDVDQLENDTTFFTQFGAALENEDDALQGVFTDADYTLIVNYLLSNVGATQGQKLAEYRTYITDTQDFSLVPGLDQVTDKFDDYTFSVEATGRDSLNGDFIVGDSAGLVVLDPYENEDGDTINYTYAESTQQAFVQVAGNTTKLPPVDDTLGGYASAQSVNENLQVAGYSSVSFLDVVNDAIDNCADPEARTDISEGRCRSNVYSGSFVVPRIDTYFINASTRTRALASFVLAAEVNATIWQLDATGDVISTQTFPLLFEREEDDTNHYYSYAFSINNQGIAVGEALTGDRVSVTRPNSSALLESERVATVYRDGETIELLPRDENILSQAIDINDNNWVAGAVLRSRSDIARSRLFAYNLDTQEQYYPDGFFTSSGVTPNAINNNNIIVGKADSVISNDSIRQTAAFMYNIETQEFTDLNDLIACDSDYELVEAVDINDNNEIIANARVKNTNRYATGVDIINSDGETELVDNIIAVKLSPLSNGDIEECEIPDDEQPYERQGASMGWLSVLALLGVALMRRRIKK